MPHLKSMLFLVLVLFSIFSPVHADDTSLIELSNTYDSKFVWGRDIGDAPLIYSIDSIADIESKVSELHRNLERLEAFSDEEKETQLWMDLKHFTEQELFVLRSCKPGVWDYAEADQLSDFFNNAIYRFFSLGIKVEDTGYILKLLNVLERLLDGYTKKVEASIDQALLPSSTSYIVSMTSPEMLGIGKGNFYGFLNRYKEELCPTCPEFENTDYMNEFDKKIQPKLDRFFEQIGKVRELSQSTVYSVPEPLAEACFTSVVASYGGEALRPSELLELGERELKRAEDIMYSLIKDQKEELSHQEKVTYVNSYLRNLEDDEGQKIENAEEYLHEINAIVKRALRFLPRVSSYNVPEPTIVDVNFATDSFVETYDPMSSTVFVNSKTPTSKFILPSLIVHEAIPGHHLEAQVSGSIEKPDQFNQNFYPPDFVEGWAFYMEEFADEIGIYRNADEKLGYLEEIRIRALRLIIPYRFFFDKWSRRQAREFSMSHSVMPDFRLNKEIGRNSHWRGQVLSYMLGKETIKKMREKAKKELGKSFSIVNFHDFIIGEGLVYPKTLESKLDYWITEQKNLN